MSDKVVGVLLVAVVIACCVVISVIGGTLLGRALRAPETVPCKCAKCEAQCCEAKPFAPTGETGPGDEGVTWKYAEGVEPQVGRRVRIPIRSAQCCEVGK